MRSNLVLLSNYGNLTLKLLRWLVEIKKHCLCWQEVLFEWPPPYDITLGIYVIQLNNVAIALRHIMSKNNHFSCITLFQNQDQENKIVQNQEFAKQAA